MWQNLTQRVYYVEEEGHQWCKMHSLTTSHKTAHAQTVWAIPTEEVKISSRFFYCWAYLFGQFGPLENRGSLNSVQAMLSKSQNTGVINMVWDASLNHGIILAVVKKTNCRQPPVRLSTASKALSAFPQKCEKIINGVISYPWYKQTQRSWNVLVKSIFR